MFKQIAPPKEKLVERTRHHAREAKIVQAAILAANKNKRRRRSPPTILVIDEERRKTARTRRIAPRSRFLPSPRFIDVSPNWFQATMRRRRSSESCRRLERNNCSEVSSVSSRALRKLSIAA